MSSAIPMQPPRQNISGSHGRVNGKKLDATGRERQAKHLDGKIDNC
jgi:hypothetical protein